MINGFKTIVLSGSTKFKKEYLEIAQNLELSGNYIVLSSHVFSKADNIELSRDSIMMLTRKHMAMMDSADEMYVIDPDGYIGESTAMEVQYFRKTHGGLLDAKIHYYSQKEEHELF